MSRNGRPAYPFRHVPSPRQAAAWPTRPPGRPRSPEAGPRLPNALAGPAHQWRRSPGHGRGPAVRAVAAHPELALHRPACPRPARTDRRFRPRRGAIADAMDRRRLLIVTQILLAGCSLALAVIAAQPQPSVWALYVVAFVAAGVGAVDQPARSSAV